MPLNSKVTHDTTSYVCMKTEIKRQKLRRHLSSYVRLYGITCAKLVRTCVFDLGASMREGGGGVLSLFFCLCFGYCMVFV